MKYLILLATLYSLNFNTKGQAIPSTFMLKGHINADNGTMILMPIIDSSYYPLNLGFQQTTIVKGKFSFRGTVLYPYAFQLGMKINSEWKYISGVFLIDPGEQNVKCHVDSLRETPDIANESMTEFQNGKFDSMDDSLLLNYTKDRPNSYVALWRLVKNMSDGYKPIYSSIYDKLSTTIKRTFTGKAVAQKLKSSKAASLGSIFPLLNLRDKNNVEVTAPRLHKSCKFTLVDFWFSHCGPCINQFNELKRIYRKYSTKGFNVIAISIDAKEHVLDWKNVVRKYQLPWQQYLDLNGVEANRLSINNYPRNFLIDGSGKIIANDIELGELEALLLRKL